MTTSRNTADVEARVTANEASLSLASNYGKNLVINGDFSIWQRGTSNTTTTSEVYVADRWYGVNSTASTITLSRQTFSLGQTDVPNNPTYYHQLSWLGTGGAASPQIGHRIENVARLGAKEVTLTFNAKTGTDFDVEVYVVQHFGTGGSPSSDVSTLIDTKSIIATWGEFTNTFTIPSVSGKTLGTNGDDYTEIRFIRNGGTAAGTFDISNVQLEFGDTATEFEYVSPADQLARCQRYFEIMGQGPGGNFVGVGYAETSTQGETPIFFSEKRAVPSFTISDVTGFSLAKQGSPAAGTNVIVDSTGSNRSARLIVTVASVLTAGEGIAAYSSTGAAYVSIDAEL